MGFDPGYCRRDAGNAATHAGSRRSGVAAIWRRLSATDPLVCDQCDGFDADSELHLDERIRLRLSRDPACDHSDLHAAVAAVWQVLPHLSTAGATRRQFLQDRKSVV